MYFRTKIGDKFSKFSMPQWRVYSMPSTIFPINLHKNRGHFSSRFTLQKIKIRIHTQRTKSVLIKFDLHIWAIMINNYSLIITWRFLQRQLFIFFTWDWWTICIIFSIKRHSYNSKNYLSNCEYLIFVCLFTFQMMSAVILTCQNRFTSY